MHGLPVSFLIKELEKYWHDVKGFEWLKPWLVIYSFLYFHTFNMRTLPFLTRKPHKNETIMHSFSTNFFVVCFYESNDFQTLLNSCYSELTVKRSFLCINSG